MSVNTTETYKKIEGVMFALMKQLQQLAPHPDRPHDTGPLFTQVNPHYKPAAEYEGMLGSIILESFLGTAFTEATSSTGFGGWAQALNLSDTAEVFSEFNQSRAPARPYQLGRRKAISGRFNNRADDALMKAYLRDLPRRLGIEKYLAHYQRKIYAMQKQAAQQQFALAA